MEEMEELVPDHGNRLQTTHLRTRDIVNVLEAIAMFQATPRKESRLETSGNITGEADHEIGSNNYTTT